jgi:hypothetical protein
LAVDELSNTSLRSALSVRSAVVEQVLGVGILIAGSDGLVEAVAVRNIATGTLPDEVGGIAVVHRPGAPAPGPLTLRGSAVQGIARVGVLVSGTEATIEGLAVEGVELTPVGTFGRGVSIEPVLPAGVPSNVTLRSSVVEDVHNVGVLIAESAAHLEGVAVRRVALEGTGLLGRGIVVQDTAGLAGEPPVTLASVHVEDTHGVGVIVVRADAAIEGSVVRSSRANGLDEFGDGVVVVAGEAPASASVERTRVEASARAGFSIFGAHLRALENALTCQSFDVDGEPHLAADFVFEDLGGNFCGCPEATTSCLVVSAGLEPPEAVGR